MDYKKLIKRGLLILGIIILLIFIKNINVKIVRLSLNALGITKIFFLIGLTFLNVFIKAIRWKLLIRKMNQTRIPLWFSFISIIAGVAGGSFIPGRIEFAKPFMLKSTYNVRLSHSLSALTIERMLDLLTLLFIAIFALFFIPAQNIISNEIIFLLTTLIIVVTVLITLFPDFFVTLLQKPINFLPFSQQLKTKGKEFIKILFHGFIILRDKTFVVLMTLLSFIANGIEVVRFYALMQFLSIDISLALIGFVFVAGVIIGIITMIPGGIGITELSISGLLTMFLAAVPKGLINIAVLIDRFIAYYLLVILGSLALIFYDTIFKALRMKGRDNFKLHKPFK